MASYGWGSRVVLATNCTQPATSLTLQRHQIQLGQHSFDTSQAQARLESLGPQHTHNNPPSPKN